MGSSETRPLLSRVADSVFWMARYIERAENVARVIEVDDFAPEALSPIYKKPAEVHQFFQELGEQRAAS